MNYIYNFIHKWIRLTSLKLYKTSHIQSLTLSCSLHIFLTETGVLSLEIPLYWMWWCFCSFFPVHFCKCIYQLNRKFLECVNFSHFLDVFVCFFESFFTYSSHFFPLFSLFSLCVISRVESQYSEKGVPPNWAKQEIKTRKFQAKR